MRTSVIISDLIAYLPPAILMVLAHSKYDGWFKVCSFVNLLTSTFSSKMTDGNYFDDSYFPFSSPFFEKMPDN